MKIFKFCKTKFHCVDLNDAVEFIKKAIDNNKKMQVCVTNVSGVVLTQKDYEFRKLNNSCGLVVADGMPIVWISKLFKPEIPERVSGADLFFKLCEVAVKNGYKFYFLGSTDKVLGKIKNNLKKKFPELKIVGTYSPPYKKVFSQTENEEMIKKINEAKPDILWVGMTAPKQEKWICNNLEKLDVKVAIGIGAVFDFVAGTVKRAPKWMQRVGLEWFFRLIQEPGRLWKRYLIGNTIFVFLVLRELFKVFIKNYFILTGIRFFSNFLKKLTLCIRGIEC